MRGSPRGHGRDQRSISLPHTLFRSPTNTIRVRPKEELMERWTYGIDQRTDATRMAQELEYAMES